MPISKSAKKAWRNAKAKRARNLLFKADFKKTLKKAAKENLNKVFSAIDKSAKLHLIHKNKAARLKSAFGKKFAQGAETQKKTAVKRSVKKTAKKKSTKKISRKK